LKYRTDQKQKIMKYLKISLVAISIIAFNNSFAQADTSQGISKSLGYYILPTKGQDASTMQKDESDCFLWAKEQSGYDPLNPPEVVAAPVDTSPDGAALKGAARGAAAGAAIGSISGDAGDGAAYGAIAGGLRARRAKKGQDQQQQAANEQGAEAKKAELLADYKKAYSLCLESKGYSLK
jgi:hypothetical protein